ncbi:ran-binding protein 3-like [Ochotona princeps]|uniref:ran-binding protein 3-like n=1 Tax=Ochotona princeps TaxID=9978 RepID=UPI0027150960|nr:ran-binding protein 3-like [Ochotona princeps]
MSTGQRAGSCHLFNSLRVCKRKLSEDEPQQEKSIIAQPIFVFENREQIFKRPAENTLNEAAKHVCNGHSRNCVQSSSFTLHTSDSQAQGVSTLSQKTMRSSSFTDFPAFLPSVPVKKNNVFMTPTLVKRNVDTNSEKQGPVKRSEHVLRPATLQAPQSQNCKRARKSYEHNTLESSRMTQENIKHKGTQLLTQPQGEKDSYAKDKIFKSTLKFSTNSSNSRVVSNNTSLIESATAIFSQPPQKCLLEKIDVLTGEEAEHNVLKVNCKLFIFNKATQSWTERGRGTLRLNDTASSDCGTLQSRLIMRNQGSLKLILNSRLWAKMKIERANHKNLRITATDLQEYSIKVFLIQSSVKDTGYLYTAIHHRLVALQSFGKQKAVTQAETQSEAILQQLNFDSCDEEGDDFFQVSQNGSGK